MHRLRKVSAPTQPTGRALSSDTGKVMGTAVGGITKMPKA